MKYLFINSVAGFGSTGRIAADKCRELMAQGHQCVLAYGRKEANCADVPTVRIGGNRDILAHVVRGRVLDGMGFGSRQATRRFLRWVSAYDPDVIWLHNIHGYYIHMGELFAYLRRCGKQILWTLHDCWSFTGHCAYFDYAGCDKWKTQCGSCPQKREYPKSLLLDRSAGNYRKKKALFTGIPNLTLITPSHWLAGLVKESYLGDYPVEVAYNTIDPKIFRPVAGDFRQTHGLEGKRLVLGVASVWDRRKGLEDFLRLAEELDDSYRIVLVGLTREQVKALPPGILGLTRTDSPEQLARIYSCADVLVNPTYEDNYPTVNLEARACGTPVVCYDTGGSRETLGSSDLLIPKGDRAALLRAIKQVCEETP